MNVTYQKIIEAIDAQFATTKPFAIWEVRNASGCSTSSVTRLLQRLVQLNFVMHIKKPGHLGRNYRVTARWINATEVIDGYEYARALRL